MTGAVALITSRREVRRRSSFGKRPFAPYKGPPTRNPQPARHAHALASSMPACPAAPPTKHARRTTRFAKRRKKYRYESSLAFQCLYTSDDLVDRGHAHAFSIMKMSLRRFIFHLHAFCCFVSSENIFALVISPPSSRHDYRQLSSLLANTFDAPTISPPTTDGQQQSFLKSKLETFQWNIIEKSLTEDFTYKQYTSTTKRMRGKKYCLLVAKECVKDNDVNYLSVKDNVVGMVEMGLSPCPIVQTDFCSSDGNNAGNNNHIGLRPQPTVGVLCVKSSHRNRGIGQALLCKCEQIAAELWEGENIFVDVEPKNGKALSFFGKCGFSGLLSGSGGMQTRNATVLRRRTAESRPHYLLRKRLEKNEI